jgi:Fur family ferric uptake transcriptional regulator
MSKGAVSPKTFLPCSRPAEPPLHAAVSAAQNAAWQTQLRDFLAEQGLKYTEQRWKIAELILASGGHVDAQQIVERVKEKHPEIGAATVYRNIKVLCDALILKESLTDRQGRVVYEIYEEGHHDHIVCLDCGEIFEFHDDRMEAQQDSVVQAMRFKPVRHRHVIYAHCEYKSKK